MGESCRIIAWILPLLCGCFSDWFIGITSKTICIFQWTLPLLHYCIFNLLIIIDIVQMNSCFQCKDNSTLATSPQLSIWINIRVHLYSRLFAGEFIKRFPVNFKESSLCHWLSMLHLVWEERHSPCDPLTVTLKEYCWELILAVWLHQKSPSDWLHQQHQHEKLSQHHLLRLCHNIYGSFLMWGLSSTVTICWYVAPGANYLIFI